MNEQWLDNLRDKLDDHTQQPPQQLWDDLQRAMAARQSAAPRPGRMRVVYMRVAAVAAAVAGVLVIAWHATNRGPYRPQLASVPQGVTKFDERMMRERLSARIDEMERRMRLRDAARKAAAHAKALMAGATVPHIDKVKGHGVSGQLMAALGDGGGKGTETNSMPLPDRGIEPQAAGGGAAGTNANGDGSMTEGAGAAPRSNKPVAQKGNRQPLPVMARWDDDKPARHYALSNASVALYAQNAAPSSSSATGFGPVTYTPGAAGDALNSTSSDAFPDTPVMALSARNETKTHTSHRLPVRVGLAVSLPLTGRLSLESGVSYTYLSSEITTTGGESRCVTDQKLHFVGVPVGLTYTLWRGGRFSVYAGAGAQADFFVGGKADTRYSVDGGKATTERTDVKMSHPQWSVNAAMGAQYNIGNTVSVFAEPGVSYFFDNPSKVETVFSDKPFNFNMRLGVKLNVGK